jgi:ferredoxin
MVDGKPVWQISRCMHCMACLQRCPKHAIEYGKGSRGKQRYLFDKYKDLLTGKKDA